MFLGEDILSYLVLALGAALVVGNAVALARPPAEVKDDDLARAPLGRSLVMILVGLVSSVWALASLVAG